MTFDNCHLSINPNIILSFLPEVSPEIVGVDFTWLSLALQELKITVTESILLPSQRLYIRRVQPSAGDGKFCGLRKNLKCGDEDFLEINTVKQHLYQIC